MENDLTVVDLFCGGGGFSEGFRQAGYNITHAVDWDDKAISTYELNTPEEQPTNILQRSLSPGFDREGLPSGVPDDIETLKPNELPDNPDVVIGSPPCTEFSWSKRGGNGDKAKGRSTVSTFFEYVAEMSPKYWVMENVPNSKSHVKKAFNEVNELKLKGDIEDYIHTLDCSNYRTPQSRKRLFFGNFPKPKTEDSEPHTISKIIDILKPKYDNNKNHRVVDPVYNSVSITRQHLTDYDYQPYLTEREKEDIRRRKVDHSVYGKMSFPEDPDSCSRTIMASDRTLARETLVVRDESGKPCSGEWEWSPYRKLKIREIASIQGFPVTYQFEGKNMREKWRRVGDAVPPTVAYCMAMSILKKEGVSNVNKKPQVNESIPSPATNLNGSGARSRRQIRITRPFRHHVPWDNKRDFRVDLATSKQDLPKHPLSDVVDERVNHPVRFHIILNRGYAKTHEQEKVSIRRVQEILSKLLSEREDINSDIRRFLSRLNDELRYEVPDATTLQATRAFRKDWENNRWDDLREFELLEKLSTPKDSDHDGVVDHLFPYDKYSDQYVNCPNLIDGTKLPVRTLMKLVGASYIAHKLNHCGKWMMRNPDSVYLPDQIRDTDTDLFDDPNCHSIAPLDNCIEERFKRYSRQPDSNCLFQPAR
jgi:DNA (cytosine-5)-methyltransferase 1